MDGILGIMNQQLASVNNLLPGARKSIPYIAEIGEFHLFDITLDADVASVLFLWKMIELNKVGIS